MNIFLTLHPVSAALYLIALTLFGVALIELKYWIGGAE